MNKDLQNLLSTAINASGASTEKQLYEGITAMKNNPDLGILHTKMLFVLPVRRFCSIIESYRINKMYAHLHPEAPEKTLQNFIKKINRLQKSYARGYISLPDFKTKTIKAAFRTLYRLKANPKTTNL